MAILELLRRLGPGLRTGTCDLCSAQIKYPEGYVFYSDTMQPRSVGEGDIGCLHLCNACTGAYINDERFQRPTPLLSMTIDEFAKDPVGARKVLQEANALGIIRVCKAHALSAAQAKLKARGFALLLWKNKQRCIDESTEFWKSELSPGPPYTLANCIEIMAGFYNQVFGTWLIGPVGGIMFRTALVANVTCTECKRPFEFSDAIDHQALRNREMVISCPLCNTVFLSARRKGTGPDARKTSPQG